MATKIRNIKEAIAALIAHHLSLPVVGDPVEMKADDARRAKIAEALKEYKSYPGLIKIVGLIDDFDYSKIVGDGRRLPDLVAGQLVVPLRNENDHDYPIGQVALSTGSNGGLLRQNGSTGNDLGMGYGGWRSATAEEATAFYANLPKNAKQQIVNRALSMGLLTLDLDEEEAETPTAEPVAVTKEEEAL